MSVVIETTLGDITIDLFVKRRPLASHNFLKLCKIKYYNYSLFHTISRGFIAQTGDPTGSRNGGESIFGVLEGPLKRYFEAERNPRIKHTSMGLVSFVGTKNEMIGSQFFFTLGADLTYLDDAHCVFGEVVEGMDVLDLLNETICDHENRPYKDVRITHTVVLDDPFPDPERLNPPPRSPSPSVERLQGGRIAPDEDIDETVGKDLHEINEIIAKKEAKARATILEMIGDIPDADMAPPENVLFVCKLNPVTTDDDLEIIFSRFGKIKSCEVIRDRKSGDSLQYAFVEFEERKSCEEAYFKMDNVLIDDRRIHVDFSQSVAKVRWHGKGRGVTTYNDKGEKTVDKKNDVGNGKYKRDASKTYDRESLKNKDDIYKRKNNGRGENNEKLHKYNERSRYEHRDASSRSRSRYDDRRKYNESTSHRRDVNKSQSNETNKIPQKMQKHSRRSEECSEKRQQHSRSRSSTYSRQRNNNDRERSSHGRSKSERNRKHSEESKHKRDDKQRCYAPTPEVSKNHDKHEQEKRKTKHNGNQEMSENVTQIKKSKKCKKDKQTSESSESSSESSSSDERQSQKKCTKHYKKVNSTSTSNIKKVKKRKKKTRQTSSSESSSDSSDEDHKTKSSNVKKKRKHRSTSVSSSSSSDERTKKLKKHKSRRESSNSSSASSDDVHRKRKSKKKSKSHSIKATSKSSKNVHKKKSSRRKRNGSSSSEDYKTKRKSSTK